MLFSHVMIFSNVRYTAKLFLVQRRSINSYKELFLPIIRNFVSQTKAFKMDKTIAIGQMRSTNDKIANRQQVQQIVESAAQKNACVRVILLNALRMHYFPSIEDKFTHVHLSL